MQQTTERNRQDEDVDQQQIEWKEPCRAFQMRLVDILDDSNLELARQEKNRQPRQQDQRKPARVALAGRNRRHQMAQLRMRREMLEDVAEAVVETIGDEDADSKESDQLDAGLQRDRRHHAFVTFGGIEMSGSENDRESRQDQGDVEAHVGRHRHRGAAARHDDFRVAEQQADGAGHRLELQSDIGNDADHGDDGDQATEEMALAVARGNEVGDRRDAVGLDDANHLQQHEPAERHHQRGTEVDRQETDPGNGGAANAAVERPGGAVNGHRQRVDGRVGDDRLALVGAPVTPPGHGKQQPKVEQHSGDDDRSFEHLGRLPDAALDGPRHQGDDKGPGDKNIRIDERDLEDLAVAVEEGKQGVVEEYTADQKGRNQSVTSQDPALHVILPSSLLAPVPLSLPDDLPSSIDYRQPLYCRPHPSLMTPPT